MVNFYVEPNSQLGQGMEDLDKKEERYIVEDARRLVGRGESVEQIITNLRAFMRINPFRKFYYIPEYLRELEQ